jgi:hypothetical protein
MRQIRNLRYTARGLPQSWQRCSFRELNLGTRFAFAIFDLLAMPARLDLLVVWELNVLLPYLVKSGARPIGQSCHVEF